MNLGWRAGLVVSFAMLGAVACIVLVISNAIRGNWLVMFLEVVATAFNLVNARYSWILHTRLARDKHLLDIELDTKRARVFTYLGTVAGGGGGTMTASLHTADPRSMAVLSGGGGGGTAVTGTGWSTGTGAPASSTFSWTFPGPNISS